MKLIIAALAASFILSASLPALAADQTATGRPTQLSQKTDKTGQAKAHKPAHKTTAAAPKDRSNKSGAARGDTRSDQVQGMNKEKK